MHKLLFNVREIFFNGTKKVWGGHSCLPHLDFDSALEMKKIYVKGGGQKCPPHTYIVMYVRVSCQQLQRMRQQIDHRFERFGRPARASRKIQHQRLFRARRRPLCSALPEASS